jgi:predicted hydrocarbon binding protein
MASVKGSAIVAAVRMLRANKDAARTALPPELHHYLSTRVLTASWYPEADMVALARATAKVMGEPEETFYEQAGRFVAHTHAEGVYRHLVRDAESQSLSRRALVLWSSQHDTGTMDMEILDENEARLMLRGFEVPSREACLINGGYLAAAFEIAGYENVHVEKQHCCVDGAAECVWSVRWSAKI